MFGKPKVTFDIAIDAGMDNGSRFGLDLDMESTLVMTVATGTITGPPTIHSNADLGFSSQTGGTVLFRAISTRVFRNFPVVFAKVVRRLAKPKSKPIFVQFDSGCSRANDRIDVGCHRHVWVWPRIQHSQEPRLLFRKGWANAISRGRLVYERCIALP